MTQAHETHPGEGTARIGSLSDGVFAIVLTLLVLQFRVPDIPEAQVKTALLPALVAQWPLLFSYILSFVVVGLYWVVHHNLFQHIVRYSRTLLYLNLLFLFLVSFLPFPAELLGVYASRLTWIIYALNIMLVGVFMTAVWWHALTHDLVSGQIDNQTGKLIALRGVIVPLVFLLSIGVSFVNLSLAYWTPLLIIPLQLGWARFYRLSSGNF